MAIFGIVYGSLLIVLAAGFHAFGLDLILANLSSAKDNGDMVQTVMPCGRRDPAPAAIVVLPVAQLRGSARSLRRYRRSRQPAIAGLECAQRCNPADERDEP